MTKLREFDLTDERYVEAWHRILVDGKIKPGQPNEGDVVAEEPEPRLILTDELALEKIRHARGLGHDIYAGPLCVHTQAREITILSDDRVERWNISMRVAEKEGIE